MHVDLNMVDYDFIKARSNLGRRFNLRRYDLTKANRFLDSNLARSSRIGWPGQLVLRVAGDKQSPREADSMVSGKELKLAVQGTKR
jgi:hypothetical protein